MDRVKNAFVTKVKSSSQLHLPLSNDEVNIADMSLEDAVQYFPIMGKLKELGWALPVRSKFRFTYIKKNSFMATLLREKKQARR